MRIKDNLRKNKSAAKAKKLTDIFGGIKLKIIEKNVKSRVGFKHSYYSIQIMSEQKFGKNNPMFGVSPWNKKEPKSSQLCMCGCNCETKPGMKYIYGHNRKGKTLPKEQCLKHSEFMKKNNPMFKSDVKEKHLQKMKSISQD